MTRDQRICALYRDGDLTIAEIAAEYGISTSGVGRILKRNGIMPRSNGRQKASVVPREMRATFVGDMNMTAAQIADAIRRRLEQPQITRAYIVIEKGRVYAPSRDTPTLDAFVRTFPQMFVGCYARGADVRVIAEDLDAVRSGA